MNPPEDGNSLGISVGSGEVSGINRGTISITGNTFEGYNRAAITVYSGYTGWTIANNTISKCNNGILLNTTGKGVIAGNTINDVNNFALDNAGGFDRVEELVVIGNHFSISSNKLVRLYSPVGGLTLVGNVFVKAADWNTDHVTISYNGNDNVNGISIVGNTTSRAGDGITLPDSATDFTVTGNTANINYNGTITPTEQIYGNSPRFYHLDTTSTFMGNGTQQFSIPNSSLSNEIEISATPQADPGNDLGFIVDKIWYDTSDGLMKVQVSETEAVGGGEARVTAKITG
jgi:hypothetical protein